MEATRSGATEQEDGDRTELLLYLCEMFTNIPIEVVGAKVSEVMASGVGKARALEILVTSCVELTEKHDGKNSSEPTEEKARNSPSAPEESEMFEMVSLVPVSQETLEEPENQGFQHDADLKVDGRPGQPMEDKAEEAEAEEAEEEQQHREAKTKAGDAKTGSNDPNEMQIECQQQQQQEEKKGSEASDGPKSRLDTMVAIVVEMNSARSSSESAWKLLIHIAEKVVSQPDNLKFRKVPLSEKVRRKLAFLDGAMDLCNAIGFEIISAEGGKQYLLLPDDKLSLDLLRYAVNLFRAASVQFAHMETSKAKQSKQPRSKVGEGIYKKMSKRPSQKISKDLRQKLKNQKRKAELDASLRRPRLSRSQLADLVQKRLRGEAVAPANGFIRKGKVSDFDKARRLQKSIEQMRMNKHRKWRNTQAGRKRVYTVSDLEQMAEQRQKAVSNFGNKHELDKIGKEALKFTNEFRTKHGKPPLEWHQALCDIGRVHSKDMGDGKVPFSHQGFKERVQKYPFRHSAAAENLAMNGGIPEAQVARVSVNGWIDSPGHRKNLLSEQTLCGIGVYRNAKGQYYLTQLFART